MRIHHRSPSSPRSAFTLVELIVAMAIIATLAALAVLIFPRLQDSQRVIKGADQLQGTFFIARNMAIRDQLPRGVRLLPVVDTDGLVRVHSLQYIEQPAYFLPPAGSQLYGVPSQPSGFPMFGWSNTPTQPISFNFNVGLFSNVDFYGGYGPGNLLNPNAPAAPPLWSNQAQWPVQPGDYLDLMGSNKPDGLYKIFSVNPSTANNAISDNLTLLSPLGAQPGSVPMPIPGNLLVSPQWVNDNRLAYFVSNPPASYPAPSPAPPVVDPVPRLSYRILRGPRPMIGQQPINLPSDVVIDIPGYANMPHPPQSSVAVPTDSQTGQLDILFAPSGKVLRDAGTTGKVVFWVWDSTGNPMAQEQTLVVIYTRTGMVASQPVNVGGVDPYFYIKDGRASGM